MRRFFDMNVLLAAAIVLAVGVATLGSPAIESSEARHSARKVRAVERKALRCVNRERTRAGLAPVGLGRSLTRAARFHSRNMAKQGFFDHVDPSGRQPWDRLALFDARAWSVGENIGAGYQHSGAVCRGWMESSGHRDNMLDPSWAYGGVGFVHSRRGYGTYFTLMMGTLVPEAPPTGYVEQG